MPFVSCERTHHRTLASRSVPVGWPSANSSEGFESAGFGLDVGGVDVEVHPVLGRLPVSRTAASSMTPRCGKRRRRTNDG